MTTELTREESGAIGRIRRNRMGLSAILVMLWLVLIAISLSLGSVLSSIGSESQPPEWVIIPIILIFSLLGIIIGLSYHLTGKLKVKEKAWFVRASVDVLKAGSAVKEGSEKKIFSDIARDLISRPKSEVVRALVTDGWPHVRAQYYTALVESLLMKCEWNINDEGEAADFRQLLINSRWSDHDADTLVGPVLEIIKDSGGRQTRASVSRSIIKNIAWIVIILIIAPTAGWLLVSDEGLDMSTKYDFLELLVLAVPAMLGLGFNIAAIFSKLRKRPGEENQS